MALWTIGSSNILDLTSRNMRNCIHPSIGGIYCCSAKMKPRCGISSRTGCLTQLNDRSVKFASIDASKVMVSYDSNNLDLLSNLHFYHSYCESFLPSNHLFLLCKELVHDIIVMFFHCAFYSCWSAVCACHLCNHSSYFF